MEAKPSPPSQPRSTPTSGKADTGDEWPDCNPDFWADLERATAGGDATKAADALVRLAEQLGCRQPPRLLPQRVAGWLRSGVVPVCRAISDGAGGIAALHTKEPQAASCLAFSLLSAIGSTTSPEWSVAASIFIPISRPLLIAAASQLQSHPGTASAVQALTASRLLRAFAEAVASTPDLVPEHIKTETARRAVQVCEAIGEGLPDALQRLNAQLGRQQQPPRRQRPPQPGQARGPAERQPATSLGPHPRSAECTYLLQAAALLLRCLGRSRPLIDGIPQHVFVAAVAQLLRRVPPMVEARGRAEAAESLPVGGFPIEALLQDAYCSIDGVALGIAARRLGSLDLMPINAAATKALRLVLDRHGRPRQVGVLLGLCFVAERALRALSDRAAPRAFAELQEQLLRAQALAADWLGWHGHAVRIGEDLTTLPPCGGLTDFSDQAALLFDFTTNEIATDVQVCVMAVDHSELPAAHSSQLAAAVPCRGLRALTMALQVPPGGNICNRRSRCPHLGLPHDESTIFPSLYDAAQALHAASKLAMAVDGVGKSLPASTLAALVRGGIACLTCSHAESAACGAAVAAGAEFRQPPTCAVDGLRYQGADILLHTGICFRPPLARTPAACQLVPALLQTLPWAPAEPSLVANRSADTMATAHGIGAVCRLLVAIFAADAASCKAVLRSGEWEAAKRRTLSVPCAVQAVTRVSVRAVDEALAASSGSGVAGAIISSSADSEAVAAAERAMRELLGEDRKAGAGSGGGGGGERSKAAAKRARKRAARRTTAAPEVSGADEADGPAPAPVGSRGVAAADCSAADTADGSGHARGGQQGISAAIAASSAAPAEPSATEQPPASKPEAGPSGGGSMAADAAPGSAGVAWRRCPLSGATMSVPVMICGGDGTSFERTALEAWLRDHPGVAPFTLQPLPPGGRLVSNHMLRQLIQQHAM